MTVLKTTIEELEGTGPINADNVGKAIHEMLEKLALAEGHFTVTVTALGLAEDQDDMDDEGSKMVAGMAQFGTSPTDRDDHLVRSFGQIGVELLNRGYHYPSLLHMVEAADGALNEGRHGSVDVLDGSAVIGELLKGLALASEDDENIPQA